LKNMRKCTLRRFTYKRKASLAKYAIKHMKSEMLMELTLIDFTPLCIVSNQNIVI